MAIADAFPDYPLADLPPVPAHWVDASWHNDTCPSYRIGDVQVWIDYADRAKREFADGARFCMQIWGADDCVPVLETDDWQEVLRHVAAEEEADRIATGIDAEAERARA